MLVSLLVFFLKKGYLETDIHTRRMPREDEGRIWGDVFAKARNAKACLQTVERGGNGWLYLIISPSPGR